MTLNDFTTFFKKTYQNRTSSLFSGLMIMASDALGLFISIGLSFFIVNLINPSAINFRSFIYYSFYFPMILIVFYGAGLYPGIMVSPSEEVRKLSICSFFCYIAVCVSILYLSEDSDTIQSTFALKLVKDSHDMGVISAFLLACPLSVIILPATRESARHLYGHFKFWGVPAVVYVTKDSGNEIINRLLKRKYLGYKPAIIIDSNAHDCSMYSDIPIFPESEEILNVIKRLNIKVAILCDYKGSLDPIISSYRYTISIAKPTDVFFGNTQTKDLGGLIAFSTTHNLTRLSSLALKRIIDIALCIIASPVFIPVTIILGFIIKITSPGPVFYGHKRVGKNGKIIKCWKFRSMYKNSQEMLEQILLTDPIRKAEWEKDRKMQDDPRVTPFGKFLRKTSLDELPQLVNIFFGNMSFVGPRPVTQEELDKYGNKADYVLSVTPGLSGMWQISGRSDTGYEERISLDTYYIQNWSVWLDVWIIIKTVWVVLNGKGAY